MQRINGEVQYKSLLLHIKLPSVLGHKQTLSTVTVIMSVVLINVDLIHSLNTDIMTNTVHRSLSNKHRQGLPCRLYSMEYSL